MYQRPILFSVGLSDKLLGLVLIGGPLLDAGHIVRLIDNDAYGWFHAKLINEIRHFRADCVMLGHSGSTAAHDTCIDTAQAIRAALPDVLLVYGGVYPTYAAREILQQHAAIDVIVLDSDILNACRNQIVSTPKLSPGMLFAGVKLTEALFHLRPAGLLRLFVGYDARVHKILRSSFAAGIRVVLAELMEFVFQKRYECEM